MWKLILATLAAAALAAHASDAGDGCITNFDPNIDYFPDAYHNEPFALSLGQTVVTQSFDFTVEYGKSYKVVKDMIADTSYVLYQCGAPKPLGYPNGTRFFEVPLKNFAIDTTVPVFFIQMLGLTNRLQETSPLVVSPCIQKLLDEKKLSTFNESTYMGPVFSGYQNPNMPMNYISFITTPDPGVLKRAEWVKYLALFFNAEKLASEVFDQIQSYYQCLNGSAKAAAKKPVAAWMYFYNGTWTVSNATYKLQYVADAGGSSPDAAMLRVYDVTKASDAAEFKQLLSILDIVIDETFPFMGAGPYTISEFAVNARISTSDLSLKFLATPNVWNTFGRATGAPTYSTDWYEGAVANPQIVLQDLLHIFHPDVVPSVKLNYFYNLAKGEKGLELTAADCVTDPMETYNPWTIDCPLSSAGPKSARSLIIYLGQLFTVVAAAVWLAV